MRLGLVLVLLSGCVSSTSSSSSSSGSSGSGDGTTSSGGSSVASSQDLPDAAVTTDAGQPGDAGFVCVFPDIPPPSDGGMAACTLQNTEAEGSYEGQWVGRVFGNIAIAGDFDFHTSGTVTFDVVCGGDKLVVDGMLEGVANAPDGGAGGYPFSGRLYGLFDEQTGEVDMIVDPATLTVAFIMGTFKVAMTGGRQVNGAWEGPWCGVSTNPTGGNGQGSWTASKVTTP